MSLIFIFPSTWIRLWAFVVYCNICCIVACSIDKSASASLQPVSVCNCFVMFLCFFFYLYIGNKATTVSESKGHPSLEQTRNKNCSHKVLLIFNHLRNDSSILENHKILMYDFLYVQFSHLITSNLTNISTLIISNIHLHSLNSNLFLFCFGFKISSLLLSLFLGILLWFQWVNTR